jgi:nickel superoxide dismutase
MQRHVALAIIVLSALFAAAQAHAHCQIPCGIYDDELRVQLIEEHITTVEKSMKQIASLAQEETANHNQLIRWVTNKESHAQEIQDIVSAYFMIQRINVPATQEGAEWDSYIRRLTLLHQIQVYAMKAKQTTDLEHVATMRTLVKEFRTAYFGEKAGHGH